MLTPHSSLLAPPFLDALKQAIVKNLKPDDVPEGLYTFDHETVLRVRGAACRGLDQMIKPTCKLPLLDILAIVVAKAGIMGPHILGLIKEAAQLAGSASDARKIGDYLETTKKAIRTVEDELIAGLPKIPRKGSFTGAVKVELLAIR
jgi:hypothetical protein